MSGAAGSRWTTCANSKEKTVMNILVALLDPAIVALLFAIAGQQLMTSDTDCEW